MQRSQMRVWAFWAALVGLITAWSHLKMPWIGDGIRVNSIELITQTGGFALLGAGLAYIRNRFWRSKHDR